MHPSSMFSWTDEAAMRRFAERTAFAIIAISVEARVMSAQAPIAFGSDGSIGFHLSRVNPLVAHLDGSHLLATISGENGYISPDWYGTEDQVPTWNYRLVEIEGVGRRMDDAGAIAQLDQLSATHEASLAPKPAWTRAKMRHDRFAALLDGIAAFAIEGATIRGIAKLGQNKRAGEAAGAIAGLRRMGRSDLATLMEQAR